MMLIFQRESPMAVTVMSLSILPSAGGLQEHVVDGRCPWGVKSYKLLLVCCVLHKAVNQLFFIFFYFFKCS